MEKMERDINLLVSQIDGMVAFELRYYYKRIATMDKHCDMYYAKCGRLDAWYHFAYNIIDCTSIQDAIGWLKDDIITYASKTRNNAYHRGYVAEARKIISRLSDIEYAYMSNADEPIKYIFCVIGLYNFNINM